VCVCKLSMAHFWNPYPARAWDRLCGWISPSDSLEAPATRMPYPMHAQNMHPKPSPNLKPQRPPHPLILSAARRYQRHLLWMQRWSSHPQNSATSRYTTAVVIDNTAACATPTPPQRLTRNAGVRTKQCA